ncbi:hypothetical protein MHU86_10103 [Fragilaria crotonensis]|nr:hypothetical protein MHU86_10103 [Fragilaria crotonensis]
MTLIQPTDIMLGRGPTCYNNPGNRVFRKLVKEHAVFYTNKARRKEKAALVKLLVSKIEEKGIVGHGLRDARLSASKISGDVNVLPKKSRPDTAEQAHKRQVKPVVAGKAQTSRIPEKRKQLLDIKAPSNLNMTFDSDSMPHDNALGNGLWDDIALPLFDNEIAERSEHWGSDGDVNNVTEKWPHELSSSSEVEQGLEDRKQGLDAKNDAAVFPDDSPSHGVAHAAHVAEHLDAVLAMYAAFTKTRCRLKTALLTIHMSHWGTMSRMHRACAAGLVIFCDWNGAILAIS